MYYYITVDISIWFMFDVLIMYMFQIEVFMKSKYCDGFANVRVNV